jgi:hypothetical protein
MREYKWNLLSLAATLDTIKGEILLRNPCKESVRPDIRLATVADR